MNIEKISKKKVSVIIAEQIESLIESGSFKPGDKLPSVRELCEQFDVGRSAVRDALSTLKGKGIVNVKQGEGTFVCQFDSSKLLHQAVLLPNSNDISELFQVRKILEVGIAEEAAKNRSMRDVTVMESILSNQLDGWEKDYQFHMAIAHSTGNQTITKLMDFISITTKKAMNDFHLQIQKDANTVEIFITQHSKIFNAIKEAEPKKAGQAMLDHLQFVEQLLKTSLPK